MKCEQLQLQKVVTHDQNMGAIYEFAKRTATNDGTLTKSLLVKTLLVHLHSIYIIS